MDAQAAYVVLEVFPCVVISSFDLSFEIEGDKTMELYHEKSTRKGKMIHDIHGEIMKKMKPSVCDPLAVIPVFNPEIVESIYQAYGHVEINGIRTRGALTLDWFSDNSEGKKKLWAIAEINTERMVDNIKQSYQ